MKEFFQNLIQITVTKVVIALLIGAVIATGTYLISENKSIEDSDSIDEEDVTNTNNNSISSKQNLNRFPASKNQSKKNSKQILVSESPVISNKNESNYNTIDNQTDYFSSSKNENSQLSYSPTYNPTQYSNSISEIIENTIPKKIESALKNTTDVFLGAPTKNNVADSNTKNTDTDTESNSNSSSGSGSTSTVQNTCSTDILAGTFGNPVGVTITCNYLSDIKYCLSKDTCCDPQSTGTAYSGAVSVGAENGNFCLSFYGESETGGVSEVIQNNYTINSTYPNLVVGSPKTYFQTTELSGETFITSSDFGKANYYGGQINFKTTDPTPSGLNYTCTEIAENDHLSLSPLPSTTLSLFDVSGLLPTNEIKIPFREDKLDYGVNFLSSYIKNNSYVVPLYSCSTTQIILEDFNYFESTMAQASVGDNNVREFEGQFSSFGFFEEDAQVFRGPAGESTNEKSGTYLESGLFSVFY